MKMTKHPNIIKLKCVVKSKQDIMLVMELIEGGQDVELFEEIKRLHTTNKDQFSYNLRWIKQTFMEISLTVKYSAFEKKNESDEKLIRLA